MRPPDARVCPSAGRRCVTIARGRAAARASLLGCALALFAFAAAPQRVAASPAAAFVIDAHDERALKSAFVFNFAARHIKWPESAFQDKTSPFVIGVLGNDPIVGAIAETCKDRRCGERAIEVRVVDAAGAARCQLLFVPAGREHDVPGLAAALWAKPVLIVADSEQAVRKGAHIGFFIENSRVRFAAHPPSARQAGLEVSSELLKLARVVERPAGEKP